MRKHLLIIIFFLAAVAGPDLLFSQEEIAKSDIIEHLDGKDYYIHSVEQGQTLYSISKVYDIAVDELLFENPDARQGLNIGQQLRIPLVSREKLITDDLRKGEFRYIFHIVRKGQTLYGISRIYNVSVDDLKAANPEWAKGLEPGQYLKIPMKDP
ncbi:MAG: LysM peptidoglycan-binding domain-containing protein, partial [Bacteroidales bacterium]|nr:LysM peptidoglycan-binding domain-containing protein [Bacteroidales bacterium]